MISNEKREYDRTKIGNSDYEDAYESHIMWVLEETELNPLDLKEIGDQNITDFLDEENLEGRYREEKVANGLPEAEIKTNGSNHEAVYNTIDEIYPVK